MGVNCCIADRRATMEEGCTTGMDAVEGPPPMPNNQVLGDAPRTPPTVELEEEGEPAPAAAASEILVTSTDTSAAVTNPLRHSQTRCEHHNHRLHASTSSHSVSSQVVEPCGGDPQDASSLLPGVGDGEDVANSGAGGRNQTVTFPQRAAVASWSMPLTTCVPSNTYTATVMQGQHTMDGGNGQGSLLPNDRHPIADALRRQMEPSLPSAAASSAADVSPVLRGDGDPTLLLSPADLAHALLVPAAATPHEEFNECRLNGECGAQVTGAPHAPTSTTAMMVEPLSIAVQHDANARGAGAEDFPDEPTTATTTTTTSISICEPNDVPHDVDAQPHSSSARSSDAVLQPTATRGSDAPAPQNECCGLAQRGGTAASAKPQQASGSRRHRLMLAGWEGNGLADSGSGGTGSASTSTSLLSAAAVRGAPKRADTPLRSPATAPPAGALNRSHVSDESGTTTGRSTTVDPTLEPSLWASSLYASSLMERHAISSRGDDGLLLFDWMDSDGHQHRRLSATGTDRQLHGAHAGHSVSMTASLRADLQS